MNALKRLVVCALVAVAGFLQAEQLFAAAPTLPPGAEQLDYLRLGMPLDDAVAVLKARSEKIRTYEAKRSRKAGWGDTNWAGPGVKAIVTSKPHKAFVTAKAGPDGKIYMIEYRTGGHGYPNIDAGGHVREANLVLAALEEKYGSPVLTKSSGPDRVCMCWGPGCVQTSKTGNTLGLSFSPKPDKGTSMIACSVWGDGGSIDSYAVDHAMLHRYAAAP